MKTLFFLIRLPFFLAYIVGMMVIYLFIGASGYWILLITIPIIWLLILPFALIFTFLAAAFQNDPSIMSDYFTKSFDSWKDALSDLYRFIENGISNGYSSSYIWLTEGGLE